MNLKKPKICRFGTWAKQKACSIYNPYSFTGVLFCGKTKKQAKQRCLDELLRLEQESLKHAAYYAELYIRAAHEE